MKRENNEKERTWLLLPAEVALFQKDLFVTWQKEAHALFLFNYLHKYICHRGNGSGLSLCLMNLEFGVFQAHQTHPQEILLHCSMIVLKI